MKFFSKSHVSELLKNDFSVENIEAVCLTSNDGELIAFLQHLKQSNGALYLNWIEQWKEVQEIIEEGSTALPFQDYLHISKHTLYADFCKFVTPFLTGPMLQQVEQKQLTETLQYIVLLESETRIVLESKIYAIIRGELNQVSEMADKKGGSEAQLLDVIHDAVNDQITQVLNAFSKPSYQFVVEYIERCFALLNSEKCTLRLANWIVIQLQKLHLNPEHLDQLKDIQQGLKLGSFHGKGELKHSIFFKIKPWLTTIFLLLFLGVVLYIFVTKPWSEQVEPHDIHLSSSYSEFSIEERKHIDSLLAVHQQYNLNEEISDDEVYVEGRELMVDARVQTTNDLVEKYYIAWENYLAKDSLRTEDNCKKLAKKNVPNKPEGFLDLSTKKKGQATFVRNESDYSIHVLVYSNANTSTPYFKTLATNDEVEFYLSPGEQIAFVAGKYSIPSPDSTASLVFCQVDVTTVSSLLVAYRLKKNSSFNHKILVYGNSTQSFQVMDLGGNFEPVN